MSGRGYARAQGVGDQALAPRTREIDPRVPLKGHRQPEEPALRFMKFPDITWEQFTDECKAEWARIGIRTKAEYELVMRHLCVFCDRKDHYANAHMLGAARCSASSDLVGSRRLRV